MSLGVVLICFPVVFLGELPDKTMFANLIMATRGRPRKVWLGAAGAFTVHVAIAVSVGAAIFALLPHRAVDAVVAAMFLAGAIWAWRTRLAEPRAGLGAPSTGKADAGAGAVDGRAGMADASADPGVGADPDPRPGADPDPRPGADPDPRPGADPDPRPGATRPHGREAALGHQEPAHKTVLTAFAVIFVAEWGDLTQVLIANLAARYHAPLAVAVGSLLALWAVAAIAVTGGRMFARRISVRSIRTATAVVLVVLAGVAAVSAAG